MTVQSTHIRIVPPARGDPIECTVTAIQGSRMLAANNGVPT